MPARQAVPDRCHAREEHFGCLREVGAVAPPLPVPGHDLVCPAPILRLQEDLQAREVPSVPSVERRKGLQALAPRQHGRVGRAGGGGALEWRLVEGVRGSGVEAALREFVPTGWVEGDFAAVRANEGVPLRVEGEIARQSEGGH